MTRRDVRKAVGGSEKVLLIGLDSLEPSLALRWAGEGVMPTFAALLQDFRVLQVDNPPGLVSGGTWQSFVSGVGPGRHGLYDAYEFFDPESYGVGVYNKSHRLFPPLWEILSEAGKRVAVIDVPYVFLSQELNGIQIMDWMTHTRLTTGGIETQPESLASEIMRRFGLDPLGTDQGAACDRDPPRSRSELIAFRQAMVARIERKATLCEELLTQQNWNFFLPVFCEAHCVGHHGWHTHDETHPRFDAELTAKVGDMVRDVYVALDRAVGRLIARAGDDAAVVVYCPFGMAAGYSASYLLDDILLRLEGRQPDVTKQKAVDGLRQLWRQAPGGLRKLLKQVREGPWEKFYRSAVMPDRATRRFFEVKANDATGGIRVNLIGRESQGLVEPGPDFDQLCDELSASLRTFVNLDTGEPLVRDVQRTDSLYAGEGLDRLPDLLVHWNRDRPILRVSSPETGPIVNRHLSMRSGDHTLSGLLLTNRRDLIAELANGTIDVTDFAPAVAAFLGVEMAPEPGAAPPQSARPQ